MKTTWCAFLVLAAGLCGPSAARADDAATIGERLRTASASVQSVVIDMEMSPPGPATPAAPRSIHMRTIVAGPGRAEAAMTAGPIRIETYQVDGMVYLHVSPGDSWRKMSYDPAHPPAQVLDLLRAAQNERITMLPDSQEDGSVVGAVQIEMHLPAPPTTAAVGPPVSLTYTYDKATYRFRSCANPAMSMTFTKYDDPSNTVELPLGAATAVRIVPRLPVPAVSPSPPALR